MREKRFSQLLKSKLDGKIGSEYVIEERKSLYYKLEINPDLEIEQKPKEPRRGDYAFQTDLLISRKRAKQQTPKVAIELKHGSVTTHDIITYSHKALRHKEVYPYLRYGMIIGGFGPIPERFFIHNEGIDFCFSFNKIPNIALIIEKIKHQISLSNKLEKNLFQHKKIKFFAIEPVFERY